MAIKLSILLLILNRIKHDQVANIIVIIVNHPYKVEYLTSYFTACF